MDTLSAFAMGAASAHKKLMVFDWTRAAELIRDGRPERAEAGLSGDMEWTGGAIYADGETVEDNYTYLASTWAKPVLIMDGIRHDCFVMEDSTEWDQHTKWPDEAKAILDSPTPGATQ